MNLSSNIDRENIQKTLTDRERHSLNE